MEDICVQKLESIKTTKSDHKIIYAIGCLTLQERKKATKTTHALIAQYCGCSEKTVQRSVAKLEKAKLITRGRPKWKKSAWFINISSDFYQQTKTIFHEQKKMSTQAQNVQTGRTIILKNSITSSSSSHLQKITRTEIGNCELEFSVSGNIGKIDLKDLDIEIGLTFSDLEGISRKIGWHSSDIQYSINNYAIALKTKTFIPAKLTAREAFIAILTGSGKKLPSLFNKPQDLLKIEKLETTSNETNQEHAKKSIKSESESVNDKIKQNNENYWLSLPLQKRDEYLSSVDGDLRKALAIAMTIKTREELKMLMSESYNSSMNETTFEKSKKKISFSLRSQESISINEFNPTETNLGDPELSKSSISEEYTSLFLSGMPPLR